MGALTCGHSGASAGGCLLASALEFLRDNYVVVYLSIDKH